jgi:hypothetical protein
LCLLSLVFLVILTSMSADMSKVITDDEIKALAERNAQRVKDAIKSLGDRYLLHPQNRISKQKPQRSVFEHAGQTN